MRRLRILFAIMAVSVCSLQSAWAQDEVVVSVSLTLPGSLGYEILKQHDPINEVTNLTVTGAINDDDWDIMRSITSLKHLDLSGASCETMPANEFYRTSNNCDADNLVTVKLPSNLKSIGDNAFHSQNSLTDVYLPSTIESIGDATFSSCLALETLHITEWPAGVNVIPNSCFNACGNLQPFTIPEGVTRIGSDAFRGCTLFKSTIPSTVQEIGSFAFYSAGMESIDVILSENITIYSNVFCNSRISSIVFPTTFYRTNSQILFGCNDLTDVYLKSATCVVTSNLLSSCSNANLKVHVPAHLLYTYKLDSYFKDFTIVGDATDDFTGLWTIEAPLTLSNTRMPANSNIILDRLASLQVVGDDAQTFNNVIAYGHSSIPKYYSGYQKGNEDWSMILNTCDDVSITGTLEYKIQTCEKGWYFFSLPFDFKVGDIVTEDNVKFAIRYYNGANRAANNVSTGNWTNYDDDDIVVPAGTGFIFQTSAKTWVTFKAQNNASKNYVMSNNPFVKTLADNSSDEAAHKGWNLVGNPWQSYYNIHKLGFTAPISVWTGSTYAAYSLIDDDYAIRPNEAFFVQSPGNSATITFPTDGRQLTEDITSQNAARRKAASYRMLVDIQIEDEAQMADKTRLVVNPEASLDYETSCDASKFLSMDAGVPQIYSLDMDNTQYAINERPADSGELRLGIVTSQEGQYTISAIRNTLGQVLLKDRQTGLTTDLSQNGYCFDAKAGVDESRFTLTFGSGITGISNITKESHQNIEVYTLDGRKVDNTTDNLKQGVYVVRKGQQAQKMIIK